MFLKKRRKSTLIATRQKQYREVFHKVDLQSVMSETSKNTYKEVPFLGKNAGRRGWKLKNLLKLKCFADIFQVILLRFKVFAFYVKNYKSTYHAKQVPVNASKQQLKEQTFILILSYNSVLLIVLHTGPTILLRIF